MIRPKIRRFTGVLVLAGGLAVGGSVLALVGAGGSPATALASAGTSLSSHLLATTATSGTSAGTNPGAPLAGAWGPGGRHAGRFGRELTVTGVSGNTITATGRGGQSVTIQVSATTAYTEAGAAAALSDIHAGTVIAVQGSSTGSSANTINATSVTIELPIESGVVTNVSGDTLTLTGFDGATHTVTVSTGTRYQKAGQSATQSDIAVGTSIVAEGALNSDGSMTAARVTIQVPHVEGQVTAVNGSTYTVMGPFGTPLTVATTASTSYVNADGSAATASAVKSGGFIIAEGSISSDGKTLTAQRIIVAPARSGDAPGRHGGFGQFGPGGPIDGSTRTAPGTSSPSTSAPSTSGLPNV